jgi:hypothetical protein
LPQCQARARRAALDVGLRTRAAAGLYGSAKTAKSAQA